MENKDKKDKISDNEIKAKLIDTLQFVALLIFFLVYVYLKK